ncbi:protein STICHEL-like 2 [Andrographis paniculata]|uniref:protein STICHEL-like 2 n=1 Tax=Andrographis paniculata TaxID=175694 RepID=UPI0021E7D4EF|nr:protein STICHEL-like 2 [Andrographis paniculata]XP_051123192.1 protein STICHEL-like 2 [Andrographis paniculata]
MDGRRHSVDVPISRALVALRRVRSLRDPATNSLSKLSAMNDNLDWETNSHNGINLGFGNGRCSGNVDQDLCFGSSRRCCSSKQVSPVVLKGAVGEKSVRPLDVEMMFHDRGSHDDGFSFGDCAEGGGSCNELDDGDVLSRAGSPYSTEDKDLKEKECSRIREMLLYRNSDAGMMEFCHQGCGISSCWSKTMRLRDSSLLPDEEQPLTLGNADHTRVARTSADWKINGEGVSTTLVESPRSFCQKFTPKSFTELVGQKTVTTSLVNIINNRKIASLYLFHGPRGTGKTSASRIFAAAMNCLSRDDGRPCGSCRECASFFSGRSRDVKEVDSVRINRKERRRLLIKNARIPPVISRLKVYIVNECHLMLREAWADILNCLEELPERVVFIMTTPNLDKIPSSAVSKSLVFHFQKVKPVDIGNMLERICLQEGLDHDPDALNFIAAKSNGSLRDAEMMLDQLSLLGKKITMSLVYEVNGFVSNDELLELLHLALSSDASNTVKKTRELLESRIDPLQLTSQLASLIMDILAGKCPEGVSEVRRKLFGTNNSEADLQQLSSALNILLQTEKQLRLSKNQTTWLTAALLQLSSTGSSYDASNARLSVRTLEPQDGDFLSTSSTGESFKHREDVETGKEELQLVWTRAAGVCTSSSFRKFLQKHGKLVSVRLNQGTAVVDLEFDRLEYVSKAEKSWKTIAGALQCMLGYNVELRINLAANKPKGFKKAPYLIRLFNCSRRVNLRQNLSAECGSNAWENSDANATPATRDKPIEMCSSECVSSGTKDLFKTIRSNEGNALSIGASTPGGPFLSNSVDPFDRRIDEDGLSSKELSRFECWRNAVFPFRKAWQLRNEQRNEQLMDYALHCASAN